MTARGHVAQGRFHLCAASAAGAVSLLVLSACLLSACSTSSPTRREEERRYGVVQEDNEFKFVSKIRAETAREDDKKVTVAALRRGTRRDYEEKLPPGISRDAFLLEVVSYLGVQYSYGGDTREGIDCSGYTCQVFKSAAAKLLPRSTAEQFRYGERIAKDQLQFGDLVFFNTTGATPSHVGIYIEDDIFAHASVIEGVTLSSLESTYYKKRFVGARRVLR